MDTKTIDWHKFKNMEDYYISDIPELNEKLKDFYIGIVDANGLESIYEIASVTLRQLAHHIFCLDMRASANSQRNAVFYIIKLNRGVYMEIMGKVKEKDFIGAGIIITTTLDIRDDTRLTEINNKLSEVNKLKGCM